MASSFLIGEFMVRLEQIHTPCQQELSRADIQAVLVTFSLLNAGCFSVTYSFGTSFAVVTLKDKLMLSRLEYWDYFCRWQCGCSFSQIGMIVGSIVASSKKSKIYHLWRKDATRWPQRRPRNLIAVSTCSRPKQFFVRLYVGLHDINKTLPDTWSSNSRTI